LGARTIVEKVVADMGRYGLVHQLSIAGKMGGYIGKGLLLLAAMDIDFV